MSRPKAIPGYEGYYVTKSGDVLTRWERSCHGYGKGGFMKMGKEFKKLKPCLYGKYLTVCLYDKDRKQNTKKVHILVLEAFKGKRPDGLLGCHNNGNVLDCRNRNLRWDTSSSNSLDAVKHKTHPGFQNRGEKHGNHRFNEKQIRVVKHALKIGTPKWVLAKMLNTDNRMIGRIERGERWGHVIIS